ncbi:MAG TPA: rhodanese-like domain-containing protein [Gemmatimonadota bacterium]|nr:rhodanese-like domain-containing protein [Gemmatimonadota bacterium]
MRRRWTAPLLIGFVLGCGADSGPDGGASEDTAVEGLPPSIPAPEMEAGILIATPERVREWQLDSVPFILVDTRDSVQYAQEHIPGAIQISYVDIRPGARLPPRDARIVVYCSDSECPISQYAHDALTQLGYGEVYDMRAGLQGWKQAGYPTEIGPTIGATADDTTGAS